MTNDARVVLIPPEPTPEMIDAGYRAVGEAHYAPTAAGLQGWGELAVHVYKAMVAAAPECASNGHFRSNGNPSIEDAVCLNCERLWGEHKAGQVCPVASVPVVACPSDTPRTDAFLDSIERQRVEYKVLGLMGFARTLERELAGVTPKVGDTP